MEERNERQEARKSAMDFWAQARADMATAITLLDAGVYYASVFFSQQAAEKALKGATIDRQGRCPKGHNLIQMANSLNAPVEVMNERRLDVISVAGHVSDGGSALAALMTSLRAQMAALPLPHPLLPSTNADDCVCSSGGPAACSVGSSRRSTVTSRRGESSSRNQ